MKNLQHDNFIQIDTFMKNIDNMLRTEHRNLDINVELYTVVEGD